MKTLAVGGYAKHSCGLLAGFRDHYATDLPILKPDAFGDGCRVVIDQNGFTIQD